jgi:hypothetical protein
MADNVFLVTLHSTLHGQLCQNGYWFRSSSQCQLVFADTLSELIQLMTQFQNTVLTKIKAYASNDVQYIRIDGATKDPLFGPVWSIQLVDQFGEHISESLPSFNAGVLSLYTGNGGRQNHGRSYYSGIGEDHAINSSMDSTQLAQLQVIGEELMLRFGVTATFPCWKYNLFHQHQFSQGVALKNALSPIVSTVARPTIRTQRKRMVGVGQ